MLSRVQLGILWIRINSLFDSFPYPQVPMDFQSIGPRLLQQKEAPLQFEMFEMHLKQGERTCKPHSFERYPLSFSFFSLSVVVVPLYQDKHPYQIVYWFFFSFFSLGLDLEVHKKLEQKTRWPFSQNLPVTLCSCQVPRYNNHCTAFFEKPEIPTFLLKILFCKNWICVCHANFYL